MNEKMRSRYFFYSKWKRVIKPLDVAVKQLWRRKTKKETPYQARKPPYCMLFAIIGFRIDIN